MSITEPDSTGTGACTGNVPESNRAGEFLPGPKAGQTALPLRGRAGEKDDRDAARNKTTEAAADDLRYPGGQIGIRGASPESSGS